MTPLQILFGVVSLPRTGRSTDRALTTTDICRTNNWGPWTEETVNSLADLTHPNLSSSHGAVLKRLVLLTDDP